jgi:phosphoribosyl 1,2-cyclic phosphodiesterase
VGFCFYEGEHKLSITTDLGYVSERIKQKVVDSDVLILETNHDVEMLRMCEYPWNIKRRILSDLGHLSNEDAADALCDLVGGRTERVYMAHLSRDNNVMELARLTVKNILQDHGIFEGTSGNPTLCDTYYDRPTEMHEIANREPQITRR